MYDPITVNAFAYRTYPTYGYDLIAGIKYVAFFLICKCFRNLT